VGRRDARHLGVGQDAQHGRRVSVVSESELTLHGRHSGADPDVLVPSRADAGPGSHSGRPHARSPPPGTASVQGTASAAAAASGAAGPPADPAEGQLCVTVAARRTFLRRHSRPRRIGALRVVIEHGRLAIGRCCALMAALVALGVISIGSMALIAALIRGPEAPAMEDGRQSRHRGPARSCRRLGRRARPHHPGSPEAVHAMSRCRNGGQAGAMEGRASRWPRHPLKGEHEKGESHAHCVSRRVG